MLMCYRLRDLLEHRQRHSGDVMSIDQRVVLLHEHYTCHRYFWQRILCIYRKEDKIRVGFLRNHIQLERVSLRILKKTRYCQCKA